LSFVVSLHAVTHWKTTGNLYVCGFGAAFPLEDVSGEIRLYLLDSLVKPTLEIAVLIEERRGPPIA